MRWSQGAVNSGWYDDYGTFYWRFISETWCNLEGRYTHIVRDYQNLEDDY